MGSLFTPQAGLVPFHPDAEGLTITDVGMSGIVCTLKLLIMSSLYVSTLVLLFLLFL